MEKLFVFLGNPGFKYSNTRHNVGWQICDLKYPRINWSSKFKGLYSKDNNNILLKPQTYMNESGISVQKACSFFKIKEENIIVVHDDLEKDFGEILLEKGGGLRGHNGLKSIKQQLKIDNFYRLRFGIGRPKRQPIASFVLSPFSNDEQIVLPNLLSEAVELLDKFSTGEIK